MSKKKKFSSRVVDSVDPMSAFIDDSEELFIPEDETAPIEAPVEAAPVEAAPVEAAPVEAKVEELKTEEKNLEPPKGSKVNVLDLLHGAEMKPKIDILEKNTFPVQLLNKKDEKVIMIDGPNVGKLYDLLEVARQYAIGYQSTWEASIKAYARHVGFPSMASLEESKALLVKWGAKLKD